MKVGTFKTPQGRMIQVNFDRVDTIAEGGLQNGNPTTIITIGGKTITINVAFDEVVLASRRGRI